MMRAVASTVMPLTLIIAAVHLLYGADAPGDGFTAGIVAGLGVALYYVVFGYDRIRERLTWLRPLRFVMGGLLLALGNALMPLLSGGAFMGLVDYWPGLDFANLKLTTTVVFEAAIALTVFGSVSLIMETIAHPGEIKLPAEAPRDDDDAQPEAPVIADGAPVQA
jgi:multisubunit Na+/H+ antiporter MnhB subunit